MRALTSLLAVSSLVLVAFGGSVAAQEKPGRHLKLDALPPAVQRTVQRTLKGATIKNIGNETADGIEQCEIEAVLNGKSRDFNVDTRSHLLMVEEETTLGAIPAAARAGILKTVAAEGQAVALRLARSGPDGSEFVATLPPA